MKIQYTSDLHLEFSDNWRYLKDNPLKPVGDVLVLAGDIGYLGDENYTVHPFWDWASDNYEKIVVTHHVPSFRMLCPKFADSKINGAFTVELADYIERSGIDVWIYGHSHYNVDVGIGKTLCVSNQLGYVFHDEHLHFDASKIIELE